MPSTKPKLNSPKLATGKLGQDKFTWIIVSIVSIVFVFVGAYIYVTRYAGQVASHLSYFELKSTIVNNQNVVGRVTATVQVTDGNAAWLEDNQGSLNNFFRKELSDMDMTSLRTVEGKAEAQKELARRFNLEYKTDKILAVLFTDILLQDQNK